MAGTPRDLRPSAKINDRDHGALVEVTAAFCAALMLLAFCARLQIRWPWRSMFQGDDAVAAAATAFSVAQMAVVVYAVSRGFGKMSENLSAAAIDAIQKIVYASDILFVVALFLTKLAVGLLYNRLCSDPRLVRLARILMIAPCAGGLISVILAAIPTSSEAPWTFGGDNASGKTGCWIAVTAISILMELGLLAFPIRLVADLQMRRSPKLLIVLAAWLRLPLIPISLLRLLSIRNTTSSPNPTFAYTNTEIYTQIEMTLAVVSATTLCLHNFLRFANSGGMDMTVGTGGVVSTMYGPGGSKTGRSRQNTSGKSHQLKGFESVKMTSLGRGQNNNVSAGRADSLSMASDSSQRNIMVRQTVDVQYGSRDAASLKNVAIRPGTGNKS